MTILKFMYENPITTAFLVWVLYAFVAGLIETYFEAKNNR
jgi:hypothetical protein